MVLYFSHKRPFFRPIAMCAAFQTRCTSCYLSDTDTSNQTACTRDGDVACTNEDVQQNRMVDVMAVMSATSCFGLSLSWLNQSQNLYADVKCCATDGCNYDPPTPVSTPPPQLPVSPASSTPPAEPGNGPCENPGLTWEVQLSSPLLVGLSSAP